MYIYLKGKLYPIKRMPELNQNEMVYLLAGVALPNILIIHVRAVRETINQVRESGTTDKKKGLPITKTSGPVGQFVARIPMSKFSKKLLPAIGMTLNR
jgi:hypothetical protein